MRTRLWIALLITALLMAAVPMWAQCPEEEAAKEAEVRAAEAALLEPPPLDQAQVAADLAAEDQKAVIWGDNFDSYATGNVFPIGGWAWVATSGTYTPMWTVQSSLTSPTATAYSPPNVARFYSYWIPSGQSGRLYRTTGVNLSGYGGVAVELRFYYYHSTTSGTGNITVNVSTDGGVTWTPVGAAIPRNDGSTGWKLHTQSLAAYTGGTFTDVRIGFNAVSDYNANMYVDSVSINYPSPTLAYSTSSVFDDFCSYTGPGQHNHIVDPGEQIQYDVTLSNTGEQAATGVSATLSTTTPGVTIVTSSANYPDIAAAGTGTNSTHFVFTAREDIACGTVINFNLHVTATGGWVWDIPFTVQVGSTSVLINENFESLTAPALPAGWTTQVISGNAWLSFNSTTYSCSTPQAMRYPWNATAAADSWAYTNGQALQAGMTYTLSFNARGTGTTFPEILGVYAGTSNVNTAMTIQIYPETTHTNSTCQLITRTFTVPSSGTYYIGFHAASAMNMFYLIVDDVRLSAPVCLPCECGISLSPTTLPGGAVGDAYDETVTGSGGVTPFTYAVTAGSLPPTLTLDPNTGAITGTLDAAGSYTFTITATDATGCTGSQQYTINVALPFDLSFYDQYGRAIMCFNSTTGEYLYHVLTGAHAGDTFEGTAAVTAYGTTLYLFGSPCGSGVTHCVSGSWNTTRHTASAILKAYTPVRYTSSLSDANYLDSPSCAAK